MCILSLIIEITFKSTQKYYLKRRCSIYYYFFRSLLVEKQKLQESFREEHNQKKRAQQYNEELQWKLKHNSEIMHKVLNQSDDAVFSRSSILSSSLNEKHSASRTSLERTLSLRDKPRSFLEESRLRRL